MLQEDFLNQSYLEWANEYLRLPDQIMEEFCRETDRINQNTKLQWLAREFHQLLYHSNEHVQKTNARLLDMGPEEGMFSAVIYASGLPSIIDTYLAKGIPLNILKDTLSDLEIWMNHHRHKYGVWGLSELGWLALHFRGRIFKLGRLQFMPNSYNVKVKIFRNRGNGVVIVLSDAGIAFQANGQNEVQNNLNDSKDVWISVYQHDGHTITGNMITPQGYAVQKPIVLTATEWELVLEEGDDVLDVHIPEGEKMSHELCRDSYLQAIEFAAVHLQDRYIKAFSCSSWLLSPQLRQILPEASNIVRFQSDYTCTTVLSDDDQMFERVFGLKQKDLSNAPRNTSLRRSLLDYVSAGNAVYGGAGFFLPQSVMEDNYFE